MRRITMIFSLALLLVGMGLAWNQGTVGWLMLPVVGMAFEIGAWAKALLHTLTQALPAAHFEDADQTANGPSHDLGASNVVRHFRALIYQKAFTAGTGTNPVLYGIEVADDTGFTTNVRQIGAGFCRRADEQGCVIEGVALKAAQRFVRINIVEDGTDAATYDAVIDGA